MTTESVPRTNGEGAPEPQALVPTARQVAAAMLPRDLEQAMKLAEMLAKSALVPKEFKEKPGDVLVAIQMGLEVGLHPIQAVQSIAVINGRPCIWGDAVLGLVLASGLLESIDETDDGQAATCTVKRKGKEPLERTFSMQDAATAKVYERDAQGNGRWVSLSERAVWRSYPKRMRQMRARSWALRDGFADVLKGLNVREEVEDYGHAHAIETEATVVDNGADLMPRRKGEPPAVEAPAESVQRTDAPALEAQAAVDADTAAMEAMLGLAPTAVGPAPAGVTSSAVAAPSPPAPAVAAEPDEELAQAMWLDKIDRLVADRKVKAAVAANFWDKHGGRGAPAAHLRALYEALDRATAKAAPAAPAPAAPGRVSFQIGQKTYETAGITRELLLECFKLGDEVDKKAKTALSKALLKKEFKVEHRTDLSLEAAQDYIARLKDCLEGHEGKGR